MEQKRRIQDIVVSSKKSRKDYDPMEIKPIKKESLKNSDLTDRKKTKESETKKKNVEKKIISENHSSFVKNKIDRKDYGRRMSASNPSLGNLNSTENGANLSVWGLVVIFVIALLIIVSNMNAATLIFVKTKKTSIPVDSTVIAYAEPVASELGYDSVIIETNLAVDPSSVPLVPTEEKASGDIIIYNEFSQNNQRLVEETRFETLDGKIYKTGKGVITNVPGYKIEEGKKVAGSAQVTVYAEKTGPEYNKEFADFTIPGFKGSPKYDKFYARSSGLISGGKSGFDVVTISQDDNDSLNIEEQIISSARNQIVDRVPDDFIIFDSMFFIEGALENKQFDDKIEISSNVKGLLFNKKDLSFVLAKDFFEFFPENTEPVLINLSEMDVSVEQTDFEKGEIKIRISGDAQFDWILDENAFSLEILGMSKKDVRSFFLENKAIEDVKIKNKPFWKKNISDNLEKVSYKESTVID